jgi:hypothetical protein
VNLADLRQGTLHPTKRHRPNSVAKSSITHTAGSPPTSNQRPRFPNFAIARTNKRNQPKASKRAPVTVIQNDSPSRRIHRRPKLPAEINIEPMSKSIKVSRGASVGIPLLYARFQWRSSASISANARSHEITM